MKKALIVLCVLFAFISCKEVKANKVKTEVEKETLITFSEEKRKEIVEFYLINDRKLARADFHEIIFLNDVIDNVKVIHYEGKDAFFTFRFSKALQFYNSNK